jgi:hypothetical protein
VRGFKVFPDVVRDALLGHPGIAAAWCTGRGATDQTTILEVGTWKSDLEMAFGA